ncbi:hypothetical protein FKG94_24495 [Exilibacterium tricleocarpae]|uniref:RING-type E3 ubiquitin transferase n=1 Tax=Exilibacterium tricleocarpae TaxID=2591008 RepID=A0A545SSS6_9GAMM|nr:LemA family protein [Exilibacterium tricleocarpae]TQV67997.1 hypothetical protein FKG94_24495 [Exilibacterium tricleocarpae]
MNNVVKGGLLLLLAVAAIGLGLLVTRIGFNTIQEMRQLERVPATKVAAALAGEVNITARAEVDQPLLSSRYSRTPSIYYRYLKEEEKRDSDGKTSWSTVIDVAEAVDFWLVDDSGRVRVQAGSDVRGIDWSVTRSLRQHSGKYRHTEWRVEPGNTLFVFGFARQAPVGQVRGAPGELSVGFSTPGHYSPIISTFGLAHESAGMGNYGLLALWGGLALVSLGVFGGICALRIHRLLVYLSILTLVLTLVLVQLALTMMRQDLTNGLERYQRQAAAATTLLERQLRAGGLSWQGWADAGDFTGPAYAALPPAERLRLREVRLNLAAAHQRLLQHLQATPEKWLVPLWDITAPPAPAALPAADRDELARRAAAYLPTRLSGALLWLAFGGGLLAAVVLTGYGFRQVRYKRLIENIPTSKTLGVSCGLAEVKGKVVLPPDGTPLQAPLSGADCTWYDYKVEEKRGSGKNSRWVTLEERTEQRRFHCRDDEGRVGIDPKGADIISRHRVVRREGRLRYRENSLRLADALYAIGFADIDRQRPDTLVLKAGAAHEPFILSNYDEATVMLRKARWGMFSLNMAFVGLLLALLMGFGYSGSFAATDFLAAALVAPGYMLLLMLILHYNDLIYLRERAQRNLANIQVSLRKRKNLVPNLEKLCRRYLAHERGLTEMLTRMRTAHGSSLDDPGQMPLFLSVLHSIGEQFKATLEDYPALQGNKIVGKLLASITRLENELSLLRAGYNDAVELYNARIASFPDLAFARPFQFTALPFLHDISPAGG